MNAPTDSGTSALSATEYSPNVTLASQAVTAATSVAYSPAVTMNAPTDSGTSALSATEYSPNGDPGLAGGDRGDLGYAYSPAVTMNAPRPDSGEQHRSAQIEYSPNVTLARGR